jgi:hypothetical protein
MAATAQNGLGARSASNLAGVIGAAPGALS